MGTGGMLEKPCCFDGFIPNLIYRGSRFRMFWVTSVRNSTGLIPSGVSDFATDGHIAHPNRHCN